VDRTQAESALLNLVVNARDAMPDGGTLTISTSAGIVEGRPDVALVVRDSGVGIAREHIGRVFEPFFTTKEPGKGTGLGLSIIYGFVKESGGNVTIDSEVGRGTSVVIHLPRATGDIDAQRPAAEPALNARAKPGEAVLIVEDDKAVCEVAVGALSELGYQVTTAANAVQALDMLASGTSAGLVFTDVMMPGGMTGYDLAHKLQTIRPELKVLVTSAHAEQLTSDAVPHSVVGFLHKPYRQDDLAVAIRRAFNIDAVE
jgi:CheY-like chemotaxis protein